VVARAGEVGAYGAEPAEGGQGVPVAGDYLVQLGLFNACSDALFVQGTETLSWTAKPGRFCRLADGQGCSRDGCLWASPGADWWPVPR
jgi:hypothetical protein